MAFTHPSRDTLGRLIFGVGARAYDVLTAQPHWRRQIARLLDLQPPTTPDRVLDLGTGPGVSAFVLAENLPPRSRVTGLDLSPQMIARAHRHHRKLAHLPVDFLVADASALPFPDASFDRVTGHSFLYPLPDPAAVLRKVARVLKPHGVATFMEPAETASLLSALTSLDAPLRELATTPNATVRFATSMALWRLVSSTQIRMTPERLAALFTAAGFATTQARPTLGGLGLHVIGRVADAPGRPA